MGKIQKKLRAMAMSAATGASVSTKAPVTTKPETKPDVSAANGKEKRKSRLPLEFVNNALAGTKMVVADLAKKISEQSKTTVTERDVRLSIDALRRMHGPDYVKRDSLRTFVIAKKRDLKAKGA